MEILSTVDPEKWTPPQITCSKCGTKFKASLDEFEKSFTYPKYYDYYRVGSGPEWIPYKFDWLRIKCPKCDMFHRVENVPEPVAEIFLSREKIRAQAEYDAHPEFHFIYK